MIKICVWGGGGIREFLRKKTKQKGGKESTPVVVLSREKPEKDVRSILRLNSEVTAVGGRVRGEKKKRGRRKERRRREKKKK